MLSREEVGVAAPRVIKEEAESGSTLGPCFSFETLNYLQRGPDNQAEEDWVTCVARQDEKSHGDKEIVASLESRHVGIE